MSDEFSIDVADWDAFETVMGPKGGSGGCWCMLWRLQKRAYEAGLGDGNKAAMRGIFDAGAAPGLIARRDGAPVGWIHIGPRAAFPRLAGSRILTPVDAEPVWSVACFLVRREVRRAGVGVRLLTAAAAQARSQGAPALEGYPIEPTKTPYPPVYAWTGFAETFRRAGFEEVARRSPTRPIFRRALSAVDGSITSDP